MTTIASAALKHAVKRVLGRPIAAPSHLPLLNERVLRRALYFHKLTLLVSDVEGSVVECGVGQGVGLALWCSLTALGPCPRRLWAFDSFQGFPQLTPEDNHDPAFAVGLLPYTKYDMYYVYQTLLEFGLGRSEVDRRISFIPGFLPDSLQHYTGGPVAIAHLDVDLYAPYRAAADFFWDRLAIGGVLAFDEYDKPLDQAKWPGAFKAIGEFLEARRATERLQKDELTGNVYLVKEGGEDGNQA